MPRAKTKAAEMASKPKFYAVKKGHNPGIYTTWKDCKFQVQGYTGNQYKGFNCRTEAEQYMRGVSASTSESAVLLIPAIPKKAKCPGLVKVKRSRSTSLITSRPSTTAEALDTTEVLQGQADDVYQVEYDGASKSNPGPAGAGALVRRPDGSVVCELREGIGSATNNVAEYRAFILGLKGALDRGIYRVRVQGDSKLVCEQVLGRWKVNQPTLAILCKEAQRLIENFSEFSVRHVDRELNSVADQLANEAVLLPETKFVSSFKDTIAGKVEAAVLGDPNWQQSRESKTYGAFNSAQSSELRLACKSYYLGFRPSSVVGAQWLRNIFSPNNAKRALALVARPRVSRTNWTLTSRCFTNMAVRLLL